ncbi:MAG: hypothetical protein LBT97_04740 [Planctomycetota bacterium]|jgi:hypothetical protein|nr:hypothetical protein [Planctomycetota bacterium]
MRRGRRGAAVPAAGYRVEERRFMGMFREFFSYFMSVMMGKRDSLTSFLEPLTMGERYYRWGLEGGDIRDFRAAMDHLHLANDRDAPMASLLLRKYNCLSDVVAAAIEVLLARHNKVMDAAVKTENDYREERETVLKTIVAAKDRVRRLQEEGSLIKAKAEEGRIAELEDNAVRLGEMLASGEGRTEIYDSYDDINADAVRFFRELDQAAAMVMLNDKLGGGMAESLSNQLKSRLDHLRGRIDQANPVAAAGQAAAGPAR